MVFYLNLNTIPCSRQPDTRNPVSIDMWIVDNSVVIETHIELTSDLTIKSIGIEYCQKITEKVSPILASILKKHRGYYW